MTAQVMSLRFRITLDGSEVLPCLKSRMMPPWHTFPLPIKKALEKELYVSFIMNGPKTVLQDTIREKESEEFYAHLSHNIAHTQLA